MWDGKQNQNVDGSIRTCNNIYAQFIKQLTGLHGLGKYKSTKAVW